MLDCINNSSLCFNYQSTPGLGEPACIPVDLEDPRVDVLELVGVAVLLVLLLLLLQGVSVERAHDFDMLVALLRSSVAVGVV